MMPTLFPQGIADPQNLPAPRWRRRRCRASSTLMRVRRPNVCSWRWPRHGPAPTIDGR
jgi:hypothetical protein